MYRNFAMLLPIFLIMSSCVDKKNAIDAPTGNHPPEMEETTPEEKNPDDKWQLSPERKKWYNDRDQFPEGTNCDIIWENRIDLMNAGAHRYDTTSYENGWQVSRCVSDGRPSWNTQSCQQKYRDPAEWTATYNICFKCHYCKPLPVDDVYDILWKTYSREEVAELNLGGCVPIDDCDVNIHDCEYLKQFESNIDCPPE